MNIYNIRMNFTYLYSFGGVSHAEQRTTHILITSTKEADNRVKNIR